MQCNPGEGEAPAFALRNLLSRPLSPQERGEGAHGIRVRGAYYFTPSNSTSNISVAFGGMTPPAPRAP
jgi:hypothetical protein